MSRRRGFTLIELLVALVMMGVVTGALYRMLLRTQRLTRAQTEQLDLQSNVRTAGLVVPNELRELNNVVGGLDESQIDIIDPLATTSIQYRAMRGLGFICQASRTEIRLLQSTWSGYREPVTPRDGAYLFLDKNPDLSSDDTWLQTSITQVATGTCGGVPAIVLTIPEIPVSLDVPGAGTPVRTFEVMKLALYPADGKFWLGAQSVSGNDLSLQPLLGPLKGDDNAAPGLSFKYLDATGAETAVRKNVKSIVLTVRGVSEQKILRGGAASMTQRTDSLVTLISLRNAFR